MRPFRTIAAIAAAIAIIHTWIRAERATRPVDLRCAGCPHRVDSPRSAP